MAELMITSAADDVGADMLRQVLVTEVPTLIITDDGRAATSRLLKKCSDNRRGMIHSAGVSVQGW